MEWQQASVYCVFTLGAESFCQFSILLFALQAWCLWNNRCVADIYCDNWTFMGKCVLFCSAATSNCLPSSAKCCTRIKYSTALCCLWVQELSNTFDKNLPSVHSKLWELDSNQMSSELSCIKMVTTETEDSHKGNCQWQAQCLQSPVARGRWHGIHMPSVCGQ